MGWHRVQVGKNIGYELVLGMGFPASLLSRPLHISFKWRVEKDNIDLR